MHTHAYQRKQKNTHSKTENRGSIKIENTEDKMTEVRLIHQLYQQIHTGYTGPDNREKMRTLDRRQCPIVCRGEEMCLYQSQLGKARNKM